MELYDRKDECFCGKRWREEMSSCATVIDRILARRFLFYGPILWKALSEVTAADLVVLCVCVWVIECVSECVRA